MIIGFAGRCRSGKTELANICEANGFQKLYFALPLKHLCADILGMTIDELNEAKNNLTEIQLHINEDICYKLANETDIPIDRTLEICNGKDISTVRDMLQFIGTDYIRKCNENWHVNKIAEMIKPSQSYVFDDVRFQNEMNLIRQLGGDIWFIVRTKFNEISNHESETSIKWGDCYNKIIINNSTLPLFKFKWEVFIDNYSVLCKIREQTFNDILLSNKYEENETYDMLLLDNSLFSYYERKPKGPIKEMKMTENGECLVEYTNGMNEYLTNILNMEDYKEWL